MSGQLTDDVVDGLGPELIQIKNKVLADGINQEEFEAFVRAITTAIDLGILKHPRITSLISDIVRILNKQTEGIRDPSLPFPTRVAENGYLTEPYYREECDHKNAIIIGMFRSNEVNEHVFSSYLGTMEKIAALRKYLGGRVYVKTEPPPPTPSPLPMEPRARKTRRDKPVPKPDPALVVVYDEVPEFNMIPFAVKTVTVPGLLLFTSTTETRNVKGIVRFFDQHARAPSVESAAASISIKLKGADPVGPEVFFVVRTSTATTIERKMSVEVGRTYNNSAKDTQVGSVCHFWDVSEYDVADRVVFIEYRLDQIMRLAILLAHHCVVIAPFGLSEGDKVSVAAVAAVWIKILKRYQEFIPCVVIFRAKPASAKEDEFYTAITAAQLDSESSRLSV